MLFFHFVLIIKMNIVIFFCFFKVPDIKVLTFQQLKQQKPPTQQQPALRKPQQNGSNHSRNPVKQTSTAVSSVGSDTDRSASSNNTEHEAGERAKMCGTLFERKPTINQEIFDEFFRREPCSYS